VNIGGSVVSNETPFALGVYQVGSDANCVYYANQNCQDVVNLDVNQNNCLSNSEWINIESVACPE